MSDKIKVVGYAQRVFFDNGIEYRNFTDDLVGNQLTENSDGESSILTVEKVGYTVLKNLVNFILLII